MKKLKSKNQTNLNLILSSNELIMLLNELYLNSNNFIVLPNE